MLELHPETLVEIAICMADFEIGSRNALKITWPAAEMAGCYFHCTQAVLRKVKALGLIRKFKKVASFKNWVKAATFTSFSAFTCFCFS
jgi:hypothetical protein